MAPQLGWPPNTAHDCATAITDSPIHNPHLVNMEEGPSVGICPSAFCNLIQALTSLCPPHNINAILV